MRRNRAIVAGILLVAAVVWVLVNKPVEGPVLLQVSNSHGLTAGDLPSVAAMLLAVLLLLKR